MSTERRPHLLSTFGLLVCALIFLGGIEVSIYSPSADLRQSLHSQEKAGDVAAADEIILENGEERDVEAGSDIQLGVTNYSLSTALRRHTTIIHENQFAVSQRDYAPANSRAPPIL